MWRDTIGSNPGTSQEWGHLGTHTFYSWYEKRNLKAHQQKIRRAWQNCEECKQFSEQYRRKLSLDTSVRTLITSICGNFMCQIYIAGLMEAGFQKKYTYTTVDGHSGIVTAQACADTEAKTTIQTLARQCSCYGTPRIIESDQGTHFTASKVQKLVYKLDIQ